MKPTHPLPLPIFLLTRSRFRAGKGAFTLIELLIVIGIIVILAALLWPAMGRAIEKGKSVKCANNLRQIFTAALLYGQDHDDTVIQNQSINDGGGTDNWGGALGPYLQIATSYTGKLSALSCPKSKRNATGNGNSTDYGKNIFSGHKNAASWSIPPHTISIKFNAIPFPSKVYAFADSYRLDLDRVGPDKVDATGASNAGGVFLVQDGIAFRHKGTDPKGNSGDRANVIFFDGHLESIGLKDMNTTGSYDWHLPWYPLATD